MKPTVGRIVHYYDDYLVGVCHKNGKGPYAAIVTSVNDNTVDLQVFPLDLFGNELESRVPYDADGKQTRYWNWPEQRAIAKMEEAMRELQKAQADPNADVPSNENVV